MANRKQALVLVWPLLAGITAGSASAPWANDELQLFFGYYTDDTGLTVQSPSISVGKQLTDANRLGAKYTYEKFSKEAPDDAVDAVSGATTVAGGSGSGFSEIRHEWTLYDSHNFGDTTLATGLFVSDESDFSSQGISLALSREMFRNNLTLTAMYGFTDDTVNDSDATAEEGFPKTKNVNSFTLAASQIASPTLVLVGGYSFADVSGYQSQPLRKISVDQEVSGGAAIVSYIYDENHPQQRQRHTVFMRAKQYFQTRSSLDANVSYYWDDWGVDAYTLDLKLQQYVLPTLIARGRFRYYQQSAADFYQQSYTEPQVIMTADNRLRRFNTLMSGIKLVYGLDDIGWRDWSTALNYEYYRETDQGLKANIVMVQIKAPLF